MDSDPAEPTPDDRKKINALLIIYLSALQNGPGVDDGEWAAAEEMKERLATELP
jgi:hypothetical protein